MTDFKIHCRQCGSTNLYIKNFKINNLSESDKNKLKELYYNGEHLDIECSHCEDFVPAVLQSKHGKTAFTNYQIIQFLVNPEINTIDRIVLSNDIIKLEQYIKMVPQDAKYELDGNPDDNGPHTLLTFALTNRAWISAIFLIENGYDVEHCAIIEHPRNHDQPYRIGTPLELVAGNKFRDPNQIIIAKLLIDKGSTITPNFHRVCDMWSKKKFKQEILDYYKINKLT
ncbi:hypothetical protein M0Q97_07535 [Candidatus Dojkabacteria bacterium]|jgi:hypothetical protein|nr:hypothetical protein [Candidatus Dojkabacteria bacterium]